jgi:hypothetical protein
LLLMNALSFFGPLVPYLCYVKKHHARSFVGAHFSYREALGSEAAIVVRLCHAPSPGRTGGQFDHHTAQFRTGVGLCGRELGRCISHWLLRLFIFHQVRIALDEADVLLLGVLRHQIDRAAAGLARW